VRPILTVITSPQTGPVGPGGIGWSKRRTTLVAVLGAVQILRFAPITGNHLRLILETVASFTTQVGCVKFSKRQAILARNQQARQCYVYHRYGQIILG
jgi:hypothetical protein